MRLWHQKLIPFLPRQQLLGQHRECCALRGKGWGKKHKIVDYVFTHNPALLVAYHFLIIKEMKRRGYNPDKTWEIAEYRGSTIGMTELYEFCDPIILQLYTELPQEEMIYLEHNDAYLQECIENLRSKGIEINI